MTTGSRDDYDSLAASGAKPPLPVRTRIMMTVTVGDLADTTSTDADVLPVLWSIIFGRECGFMGRFHYERAGKTCRKSNKVCVHATDGCDLTHTALPGRATCATSSRRVQKTLGPTLEKQAPESIDSDRDSDATEWYWRLGGPGPGRLVMRAPQI